VCCSRQLAETSPYMEAMRQQDVDVLFCYEPYDELVLMNLAQFDRKNLKSIENEVTNEAPASTKTQPELDAEPGELKGRRLEVIQNSHCLVICKDCKYEGCCEMITCNGLWRIVIRLARF